MTIIKNNIDTIKDQIAQACQKSGRVMSSTSSASPSPVLLLAVSKTKPVTLIEQAYQVGQHDFGENYLQEAVDKIATLAHLPELTWHFIGPIQSNKTKQIASSFSWVHSVDREKIALRLNKHLQDDNTNKAPLNICLQVNISDETSKSGVNIAEVFSLAKIVASCDKLTLRGLMAVPEKNAPKACYEQMQQLFIELKQQYPSVDTLSLGMSDDLDIAIAHGSTMVRIGTAIFGARANKI